MKDQPVDLPYDRNAFIFWEKDKKTSLSFFTHPMGVCFYEGGNMKKKDKSLIRTTIVLTEFLDYHISLLNVILRTPKNTVMREALETFVRKHGLDPHKAPKVTVRSG